MIRILLKNWFLLSYLVAIASWQFLTNTPLTVRIVLTLTGICVVTGLLAYLSGRVESVQASPAPEPEKREFVDDPAAVLEIAKLTGYEAVRRFAPYLGKWMTITGTYEGKARSLGQDAIHVSILLKDSRRLNVRFGVDREDEIRGLRAGQRIAAICRIQQFNLAFVPDQCELLPSLGKLA
jgi:hypothetical protein